MASSDHEQDLAAAQETWDRAADTFDREPDHGLHPAPVLQAWTDLLRTWLPRRSGRVLDLGCGTGSLSVVLDGLGQRVTAADLSPVMLAWARAKAQAAAGRIEFVLMDAAWPGLKPAAFDALVCRHLLWALPDPARALERSVGLLRPGGRLILVEGFWETGGGLHADQLISFLPPNAPLVVAQNLADRSEFWGKPVTDERYVLIADRAG